MSVIDSRWPTLAEGARRRRLSSALLEAMALARGLDTVRVSGDSFVAGHAPLFSAFGFWGTLSSNTSRAAMRITSDRAKRKAALLESGVRVPQSRRFGYKNIDAATTYGLRFSRGVVIKPRAISAGRVPLQALTDRADIREAINGWNNSPRIGPDYLVEGRIHGPEYAFFIVGDQVESVVQRRNQVWSEEIYRRNSPCSTEIHPEVYELAVTALRAMPSAPYGEVRIAGHNSLTHPSRARVVSVRATIELIAAQSPPEWSLYLAEQLVSHLIREAPGMYDPEARTRVNAQITATEMSNPAVLATRVNSWLDKNGIEGELHGSVRELRGNIVGTPGELASLASLMRTGQFVRELPQTVKLQQSVTGDSRGNI